MEGFVDIGSRHLYVKHVHGHPDAPTLIFLHDAWGCVERWGDFPQRIVGELACNSMLYDRAGHGRSGRVDYDSRPLTFYDDEAAVLVQLMDELRIERAVLFGHSDGATIAIVAAGTFPERIDGLILQSPHVCAEPEGLASVAAMAETALHTRLHRHLSKYHGENMPAVFDHWRRMWSDERFRNWNIAAHIRKTACPVLAFRGANDPLDTIKQLTTIEQHTGGKIITGLIPDAAHSPHKENPEATLRFVLENKMLFF